MKFEGVLDFYPYYLGEHRNGICRMLHVIGSSIVLGLLATTLATQNWTMLAALPVAGYGFAWLGHFGFEKNRPATFKYPFLSLACDWVMFAEILSFRLPMFGDLPAGRWKTLAERTVAA